MSFKVDDKVYCETYGNGVIDSIFTHVMWVKFITGREPFDIRGRHVFQFDVRIRLVEPSEVITLCLE